MISRPPLPLSHANPYIQSLLNTGVPDVKYQILSCQGNDILVGRLKISTPTASGHAFILRRYDTGAVSLTTMFRAAFPTATDEDEKRETLWVKDNHDLAGNNGTPKDPSISRLAGTWVDPELAKEIAQDYKISEMINVVIEAVPDPNVNYRRSAGSGGSKGPITVNLAKPTSVATPPSSQRTIVASSPQKAPSTTSLKPPSRSSTLVETMKSGSPVAKRRKESSPIPTSSSPPPDTPRARRSNRTRSPAPKPSFIPVPLTSSRTPKKPSRLEDVVTPAGSDETAYEEDGDSPSGAIATSELHDQDVAEQKQMIAEMKAQRDAAQHIVEKDEEDEDEVMEADDGRDEIDDGEPLEDTKPAVKRTREDIEESPLKFNFKEHDQEEKVEERAIATNRRITGFNLEPRQKSFAWGVAAFALGFGAVTFLPNFF